MHPTDELREVRSASLRGRRVVLGITGSIAAVECVRLARELIRHGASVHAVMTPEACKIVGPYAMGFATANPVITELTGAVEHVSLCGDVEGRADLLLIAPCTANTLGKVVAAVDDTPVTTFATTAIGTGMPVMVVPAMHNTMYAHPLVKENLEKARSMGVEVVDPVISEKKAKMASADTIVERVIRTLSKQELSGKRVLVVTGATREHVDDMRVLTNLATGRSGVHLAREAFRRGGDVLLLCGQTVQDIPAHIRSERFSGSQDLWERLERSLDGWGLPDIALFPAGISDYIPVRTEGKIPSGKEGLTVELVPGPKVIDRLRKRCPGSLVVGFKAESVNDPDELIRRAYRRSSEAGMDLVVANDLSDVGEDANRVFVITPDKEVFELEGSKGEIATFVIDKCVERLG